MSDFRDLSPNIVGSWGGLILSLGAVPGKALLPGPVHPVAAGLAGRLAAALVFGPRKREGPPVGGDVADALVEPDRVVVHLDEVELGAQDGGVGDCEQVWPLDLDGPVQRLDPGLVGRGRGPAEVLRD